MKSFLKRLIDRLARGAVPVDGVLWSDLSDAPHSPKNPAAGSRPERPEPTAAEFDPRQFPRNGGNFR